MGRGSESTGLDCSEEEQKAVDDIIVDHLGKVISSFPLPQSRAHTNPNTYWSLPSLVRTQTLSIWFLQTLIVAKDLCLQKRQPC